MAVTAEHATVVKHRNRHHSSCHCLQFKISMTTLYLIRHGQASIGTDNYDVLSPLGERQAALLGKHLQLLNVSFDAVYSGSLTRQKDTAAIALNHQPVSLEIIAGFNEYHHAAIYQHYAPRTELKSVSDHNAQLEYEAFSTLMNAWTQDNETNSGDLETWLQFKTRIHQAIDEVAARHNRDDTVAIFTSGGVICTLMQRILQFPTPRIFEINWGIYNASISKIKLHRGGMKLREYNNITHLLLHQDDSLVTNI